MAPTFEAIETKVSDFEYFTKKEFLLEVSPYLLQAGRIHNLKVIAVFDLMKTQPNLSLTAMGRLEVPQVVTDNICLTRLEMA